MKTSNEIRAMNKPIKSGIPLELYTEESSEEEEEEEEEEGHNATGVEVQVEGTKTDLSDEYFPG
jgi:hypothetical protein